MGKHFSFVVPIIFLAVFFYPRESSAVPYFAVFEGAKCSLCHVSMTGAGMRKEHGIGYYKKLSLEATKDLYDDEFRGKLGKFFAVGGDLRFRHLADIQSPTAHSFGVPQGSFYVRAEPISRFTLYTDVDIANVINREAFGLIHELPYNLWIKFGRFNVPYGLRIPDDTSFIRNDLGFNFGGQDIGLEFGIEPGPFSFALAFTNGVPGGRVDDNENKTLTSSAAWVTRYFRVGGSVQWSDQAVNRLITGGGHFGATYWNLALLGEFDVQSLRNKAAATDRTVLAGYGELDWRIIPGLVFKGTYDITDDDIAGSGLHHRLGAGFEVYPLPNLEVSVTYRARIGTGALGQDQIFTQIHGFY